MDGLVLSRKVRRILESPERTAALGKRLLSMEKERKCNFDNHSVREIYDGMQTIAKLLVKGVRQLDPKFDGQLFGTGSYFDRLKVGVVDEFDFMLQLKALSGHDDLAFLKSEPGFANVSLRRTTADEWPTTMYCLTHEVISNRETINVCATMCDNVIEVLDASGVQDKFREVTDKVLKSMVLPEKWEHGGFNRPAFGGFRKHGPATLYQFVWVASNHEEEIKVNLDLTMSIKIPTPTDTAPFQFDFSKRFPATNHAVQDINNQIVFDPGLSIIPLYSNFMIATGKSDKKYSWKVSCSTIEQKFLNTFGDNSLLKTLIRVLKILRDDYLTYYKRKTRRGKRKYKTKTKDSTRTAGYDVKSVNKARRIAPMLSDLTKFGTNARDPVTLQSPGVRTKSPGRSSFVGTREAQSMQTSMPVDDRLEFVACARELRRIDDRMDQQGQASTSARDSEEFLVTAPLGEHRGYSETQQQHQSVHMPKEEAMEHENVTESPPVSANVFAREPAIQGASQHQEVNTDLTEIEELTALEYQGKYQNTHSRYQRYDVGQERATPQPGSGEYYGPRQYVASIEIKFMAMSFILNEEIFPDKFAKDAEARDLGQYVLLSLERFRRIHTSRCTMSSIYFPSAVCTPLSVEKRRKVLKQIDMIIGMLDGYTHTF